MTLELRVPHAEGCAAFVAGLAQFVEVVSALDDRSLLAASRCWGWAVVDVICHVRAGLGEVAAALLGVGPVSDPPSHDAASYWLTMPPASGSAEEVPRILATRRLGSATARPNAAVAELRDVAAALRVGIDRLGDGMLEFQGVRLTTGDFLTTWAVELVVHQLDFGRDLVVAPPYGPALALTRRTLEALLESPLPAADDIDAVLLGTGRRVPTDAERAALGDAVARLPVL